LDSYLYQLSVHSFIRVVQCIDENFNRALSAMYWKDIYSYRKDDRWRSKLRPRKAPDALTSFLSQSLHERPHRKLSLLRYIPLDVRLSCTTLCRRLKGTLFLPVFFFSFHTRSRSLLDSFYLYHFISQFLSFFCQLYLLIKLISSNMIFSYRSKMEGEEKGKEECASTHASIKVYSYPFMYFLPLLYVPLLKYQDAWGWRCFTQIFFYIFLVDI